MQERKVEFMSISWKGESLSQKASLAGTVLALVSLVGFVIYGAIYTVYFDLGVIILLLAGAVCSAAYVALKGVIAELAPLAAVLLITAALGLFFLNSYPVWADWYGGFTMYGSEGGIAPVIVLIVLYLLAVICDMIACFTARQ